MRSKYFIRKMLVQYNFQFSIYPVITIDNKYCYKKCSLPILQLVKYLRACFTHLQSWVAWKLKLVQTSYNIERGIYYRKMPYMRKKCELRKRTLKSKLSWRVILYCINCKRYSLLWSSTAATQQGTGVIRGIGKRLQCPHAFPAYIISIMTHA